MSKTPFELLEQCALSEEWPPQGDWYLERAYIKLAYQDRGSKLFELYEKAGDGCCWPLVAKWTIAVFPGSPYTAISLSAEVTEKYRGKGLGTAIHGLRLSLLELAGFSRVVCVVKKDNEPQVKILRHHEWELVDGGSVWVGVKVLRLHRCEVQE